MDIVIKGEFKWTEKEYVSVQSIAMRNTKLGRKIRRLTYGIGSLLVLIGILGGVVQTLKSSSFSWQSSGLPLVLLGMAMFLFQVYFIPRAIRKSYAQFAERDAKITWECNAETIFVSSEKASSQLKWSGVSRALQTSSGILLFPGERLFYWLPTHSFQNSADILRLSELVKSKVPDFKTVS